MTIKESRAGISWKGFNRRVRWVASNYLQLCMQHVQGRDDENIWDFLETDPLFVGSQVHQPHHHHETQADYSHINTHEQSLPLRPEEIQQIMKLKQELDTEILYKRKELDMVNQRLILTNQLMQQLEQIWSQKIYDEEAINNFNKSDYRNKKKRKRMEPIRSVIDQSIHAQADLGDESSRMVITKRVFVGNSDKFLSKGDYEEHLWVVYVRGANNEDIGRYIKKVRFFLHPDYQPHNIIEVESPPFQLTRKGYFEFPVRVQLFFHDPRNKPFNIIHRLKFSQAVGKLLIGHESEYSIELDRNSILVAPPIGTPSKRAPKKEEEDDDEDDDEEDDDEDDDDVPRKTFESEKELLQFIHDQAVNEFPLISTEKTDMSYSVAKNIEQWYSWSLGKRKASEYKRALQISNVLAEEYGIRKSAKEIMAICRSFDPPIDPATFPPNHQPTYQLLYELPAVLSNAPGKDKRNAHKLYLCRFCGRLHLPPSKSAQAEVECGLAKLKRLHINSLSKFSDYVARANNIHELMKAYRPSVVQRRLALVRQAIKAIESSIPAGGSVNRAPTINGTTFTSTASTETDAKPTIDVNSSKEAAEPLVPPATPVVPPTTPVVPPTAPLVPPTTPLVPPATPTVPPTAPPAALLGVPKVAVPKLAGPIGPKIPVTLPKAPTLASVPKNSQPTVISPKLPAKLPTLPSKLPPTFTPKSPATTFAPPRLPPKLSEATTSNDSKSQFPPQLHLPSTTPQLQLPTTPQLQLPSVVPQIPPTPKPTLTLPSDTQPQPVLVLPQSNPSPVEEKKTDTTDVALIKPEPPVHHLRQPVPPPKSTNHPKSPHAKSFSLRKIDYSSLLSDENAIAYVTQCCLDVGVLLDDNPQSMAHQAMLLAAAGFLNRLLEETLLSYAQDMTRDNSSADIKIITPLHVYEAILNIPDMDFLTNMGLMEEDATFPPQSYDKQ